MLEFSNVLFLFLFSNIMVAVLPSIISWCLRFRCKARKEDSKESKEAIVLKIKLYCLSLIQMYPTPNSKLQNG